MSYTFSKIAEMIGALPLQLKKDSKINRLALDSRLPVSTDSLFVAIAGVNHNSHDYLTNLYERGVRNFIVSEDIDVKQMPDANFIRVTDSIAALQQIAAKHRIQFEYPLIAITGSNGKTTIKEWLSIVLEDKFDVIRSPRSYNSQVGVPLSLWEMNSEHNLAIIEAGISEKGEMEKLQAMIRPTIGMLSNIGEAHQAGFDSTEQKTLEKLKLFREVETLIYRKGAYGIEYLLEQAGINKGVSWTSNGDLIADYQVKIDAGQKKTQLLIESEKVSHEFSIPFSDAAAIENSVHCIVTALHLNLDASEIDVKLFQLAPLAMRLEMIQGLDNCTILNDAYNSDIHSLKIALATLDKQIAKDRKSVILSDIEQSGKSSAVLHQELAELLSAHKVNRLIGIGENLQAETGAFNRIPEVLIYKSTEDFLEAMSQVEFDNEAILVKGARKYRFEKIVNRLVSKKRQTVLEVDLNAVQENLNYYKSLLKPSTRMMVMVKALSYGAGSMEISKLLQYNKVDYLCVAYPDEGVELRKAGIHLPVMVLNSNADDFALLARYQLEPVIFSLRHLKELDEFTSRYGEVDFPVHIELDTGMHRLGIVESELEQLQNLFSEMPAIKVRSVFSHLSSSDDPADEAFTRSQFKLYERMYESLLPCFKVPPIKHILNTAGIENYPQHQYDMVRLGIGLYGVSIQKNKGVKSISTLKSFIAQIKELKAGESIGYNRSEKLKRDSKIAVVNIGYGDGLPRKAGNQNYSFQIANKPAVILGNVCMDMCMVDISDIPEAKVGDEVIVFGEQLPVERLAELGNTISYEILTGISPRVKRVYLSE